LVCDICSNQKTDKKTILIVERDTDLTAIIRTNIYKGLYFVLGGSVPILEKEPEKLIRLKELFNRINELVESSQKLEEIIIGTSITPAGEHTDEIIRTYLKNLIIQNNIKIKSLGRGISTGTEIEYIDPETFSGALKNRS
jgi:recombination protein RecR